MRGCATATRPTSSAPGRTLTTDVTSTYRHGQDGRLCNIAPETPRMPLAACRSAPELALLKQSLHTKEQLITRRYRPAAPPLPATRAQRLRMARNDAPRRTRREFATTSHQAPPVHVSHPKCRCPLPGAHALSSLHAWRGNAPERRERVAVAPERAPPLGAAEPVRAGIGAGRALQRNT